MIMIMIGTWKGGREKSPAAFCRKAVVSTSEFEMWGDGLQTRSFMFIEDCVEGSIRIMLSDCKDPLNLGTDEMIDMNQFAKLAMSFEGKDLPIKHIPGPEGVRGRNSDNTMIKEKLNWAPSISIHTGLKVTWAWIKEQIAKDVAAGSAQASSYATSEVVLQVTDSLDGLNKHSTKAKEVDMIVTVKCFREETVECVDSLKLLNLDCESNFTPYVEPSDIIMGSPWLTVIGPNYIAFDGNKRPLGFLAIGWRMSQEEMMARFLNANSSQIPEKISCGIRADFEKIKDHISELSQLIKLSPTELSKVFGGSYNMFIYVASNARRFHVGEKLMSCLPDLMKEKIQEGCNIRYSSMISNFPSISLFIKISEKMGLRPDVYLKETASSDENIPYDQFIYFLLSPNSTGVGYKFIVDFINKKNSTF
jgi:hypothetical protein